MLNAIFFYRISRWLYLHQIPFLPKLVTLLIFLMYNCKIPYQARIGRGTKFGYGGIGVVIHKETVVGENCMIAQHVTIGGGGILTTQEYLELEIMYMLVMGQSYLVVLLLGIMWR